MPEEKILEKIITECTVPPAMHNDHKNVNVAILAILDADGIITTKVYCPYNTSDKICDQKVLYVKSCGSSLPKECGYCK